MHIPCCFKQNALYSERRSSNVVAAALSLGFSQRLLQQALFFVVVSCLFDKMCSLPGKHSHAFRKGCMFDMTPRVQFAVETD